MQGAAGTVAQINPAIMLMAIAISTVTKKLDQIEDAQKDIIEFLQLKEKAVLKGNIAVLQEILDDTSTTGTTKNTKTISTFKFRKSSAMPSRVSFSAEIKLKRRSARKDYYTATEM